jgi:hypothetical protein
MARTGGLSAAARRRLSSPPPMLQRVMPALGQDRMLAGMLCWHSWLARLLPPSRPSRTEPAYVPLRLLRCCPPTPARCARPGPLRTPRPAAPARAPAALDGRRLPDERREREPPRRGRPYHTPAMPCPGGGPPAPSSREPAPRRVSRAGHPPRLPPRRLASPAATGPAAMQRRLHNVLCTLLQNNSTV